LTMKPIVAQSIFNLVLALMLGVAIGLERQFRKHPAGLHTHALVCMGSAAYTLVALLIKQDSGPTRIAGQVVTGVGFMCAGVIWHHDDTVRGLNTAATIWCTAAVGVLAGLSFSFIAIVAAAVLLGANVVLHRVEHQFFAESPDR